MSIPEQCNGCLIRNGMICPVFKSARKACANGLCRAKRSSFEQIRNDEYEHRLYLQSRGMETVTPMFGVLA